MNSSSLPEVDGPWTPVLPPGRAVRLEGRGTTFVRDVPGPSSGSPDDHTFVLLHGLTATADLNWFSVFNRLSTYGRVVALDQRGHGDGIRDRHLLLEALADDVAALLDELEIERAVIVGFSMGGAVAQLMWRRHREMVSGLVLVATAAEFPSPPRQRRLWAAMSAAGPVLRRLRPVLEDLAVRRAQREVSPDPRQPWAQSQLRRNEPLDLLAARRRLAAFSSLSWCASIDVPVSFVLTERDQVVLPDRQRSLIDQLADVEVEMIDAEHGAFVEDPDVFAPAVERACVSVVSRVKTETTQNP